MKTIYKVYWDNGASACGTFSDIFDTYEEAEAFADQWADESNERDFGTRMPDVEGYSAEVVEESIPDDEDMEIDDGGRRAGLSRGQP